MLFTVTKELFGPEAGLAIGGIIAYWVPMAVVIFNLITIIACLVKHRGSWKYFLAYGFFCLIIAYLHTLLSNEEACLYWIAIALLNAAVSMILAPAR